MTWRFVDSDLAQPEFTVAADEAIALARAQYSVPNTLHVYRREVPTVSLGYFQSAEDDIDLEFCKKNGIRVVRRATGGSAIYTDPDHIIYGVVAAEDDMPPGKNETYQLVCSGLVAALDILGIKAEFKPVNDVLVEGRKISGSAQMRRKGIVLQHGTLMLSLNREMMFGALKMPTDKIRQRGLEPETYLTSLEEVLGEKPNTEMVKGAMVEGFGKMLGVDFVKEGLTEDEIARVHDLIDTKYGCDDWNLKR